MGVALLVVGMLIQFAVETWVRFGNCTYESPLGRFISYVTGVVFDDPWEAFCMGANLGWGGWIISGRGVGGACWPFFAALSSCSSFAIFRLLESMRTKILFSCQLLNLATCLGSSKPIFSTSFGAVSLDQVDKAVTERARW